MEPILVEPIVKAALLEDLTWLDVTSDLLIGPDIKSTLTITLKEEGIIAGLAVAEQVFRLLDPELSWTSFYADGTRLKRNEKLAMVKGKANSMLKAERVALNFLQRMCGIATITGKFVEEVRKASAKARIADTRKTTPGLRLLEKYAVRMGGGVNHRYNLSDAVLIKDNHIAILIQEGKSLRDIIREIKAKASHTTKIEVEVDSLDQFQIVMQEKVDAVLLDNMSLEDLRKAVEINQGRIVLEASGGINLENVGQIAATGVDIISVGALTHSVHSLDISLDYL